MMYPLKFRPVYKETIWGGRNLEKLGKNLPEGNIAESWELSCHPDGVSEIANGEFEGMSLPELVSRYGLQIIGHALPQKHIEKFPLLIKLIDANDKLSVQVHPEDEYAMVHENGELGKNEMWYIIAAKPGAMLVYDVAPSTTRDSFAKAIEDGTVENCLKYVEVQPGDTLNIPAGLVHAIGEGIVLAEVQQSSNTTYRVYDYERVDKDGNKRPLHIEKALSVIDFNSESRIEKVEGLRVSLSPGCSSTYKIANKYFAVELYDINGTVEENADGSRFHIYIFLQGKGEIHYNNESIEVETGETILIPASMGAYELKGSFTAIKSYVPDLQENIMAPLLKAGYREEEIYSKVAGVR